MKNKVFLSGFVALLYLVAFSFVLSEETLFASEGAGVNIDASCSANMGVVCASSDCCFGFSSEGAQILHPDNTYEKSSKYIQLKENYQVKHSFLALFVSFHSSEYPQQSLIKLRRLNI